MELDENRGGSFMKIRFWTNTGEIPCICPIPRSKQDCESGICGGLDNFSGKSHLLSKNSRILDNSGQKVPFIVQKRVFSPVLDGNLHCFGQFFAKKPLIVQNARRFWQIPQLAGEKRRKLGCNR